MQKHIEEEVGKAVIDLLMEFDKHPQEAAQEYGKKSAHCCFCNTPIENPKSLHVGYGPVCAKHYGLHYPTDGQLKAEGVEV